VRVSRRFSGLGQVNAVARERERLAGLRTLDCPWHYLEADGWCADPQAIDRAAQGGARLFVLVSPGNPTGAHVDAATARQVGELGRRHGAAIIVDEVFAPFTLEDKPAFRPGPPGPAPGPAREHAPGPASERAPEPDQAVTFTFNGLSKLLCAPQLKLGWIRLAGPAQSTRPVRAALDQIADTFLSVNTPTALALPELLGLAEQTVAHTNARLAANLATAKSVFGQAPYRLRRCGGGWSAIIDLPREPAGPGPGPRDQDQDQADPAVWLLRHAHLAVHPGWFYDIGDRPCLVVSLLPESETFARNCRRLRDALETRRSGQA
jgi:aspartate/methionine/tyrosine aminotransferase